MKITVKHKGTEITIDRHNFIDYSAPSNNGQSLRTNIMKDTVMPMLNECIEKIKELTKDEL